ncbi:hypothetical protein [Micromonospora cathayae]|uniref:Uncharacterized protein n=1 Tax=Micromonospora cathayae TaxID=3028804 RepID=A0ABY7ZHC0_9ACTN|nr:hypothetical protein [Micromonospora sp. HUAS 3]WDZ82387.1 hypothetical protein PVK37_18000 [Micromonospora sp. HUAS 3]
MTAILNPTGPAPLAAPDRAAPVPRPAPAVGPVLELPGTPATALVPVTDAGRPVGAFVLSGGRLRYRPVVDPDRLVAAAAGVLAAGLLAAGLVAAGRRRPPAVGAVTMGPGGWISVRGAPVPALRAARRRPWWARALRARRLVVER